MTIERLKLEIKQLKEEVVTSSSCTKPETDLESLLDALGKERLRSKNLEDKVMALEEENLKERARSHKLSVEVFEKMKAIESVLSDLSIEEVDQGTFKTVKELLQAPFKDDSELHLLPLISQIESNTTNIRDFEV